MRKKKGLTLAEVLAKQKGQMPGVPYKIILKLAYKEGGEIRTEVGSWLEEGSKETIRQAREIAWGD